MLQNNGIIKNFLFFHSPFDPVHTQLFNIIISAWRFFFYFALRCVCVCGFIPQVCDSGSIVVTDGRGCVRGENNNR